MTDKLKGDAVALLACPFCGWPAEATRAVGLSGANDAVNCTNRRECDAAAYYITRATWNRRATPAASEVAEAVRSVLAALVKVREQILDVECESSADSNAVGRCCDTIDDALRTHGPAILAALGGGE